MMPWKLGNSHDYEAQSQEANPVVSLNQFIVNDYLETITSTWHVVALANEIALLPRAVVRGKLAELLLFGGQAYFLKVLAVVY